MKKNIIKQVLMGILITIAFYGNTQPYVQTIAGSQTQGLFYQKLLTEVKAY